MIIKSIDNVIFFLLPPLCINGSAFPAFKSCGRKLPFLGSCLYLGCCLGMDHLNLEVGTWLIGILCTIFWSITWWPTSRLIGCCQNHLRASPWWHGKFIKKREWRVVPICVVSNIWKERNLRTCDELETSFTEIKVMFLDVWTECGSFIIYICFPCVFGLNFLFTWVMAHFALSFFMYILKKEKEVIGGHCQWLCSLLFR